ncbi:MAG: metal ABC transporter ATP-binding protein [Chlamydiota bacterium]
MTSEFSPLEVRDLTISYHNKPVIWDIDFQIPRGKAVAIVGPNGAGKTTLLKGVMKLLPLASGHVSVYGKTLEEARSQVAYVPQRGEVDWDFPTDVLDVVLMGRYGHSHFWRTISSKDQALAYQALHEVGMEAYAKRQISQLSGGQQQRVFIARALVQQSSLYLMDEPFAGVDASTERAIVKLFKKLKERGDTVVCVHHDLHKIKDYFDWIILMNMQLIASGPTEEVFTLDNINAAYGDQMSLLMEVAEKLGKEG